MHTRSQGSKRFLTAMGLHSAKRMVVYEGEFTRASSLMVKLSETSDLSMT